jgi:hypothetical protein
LEMGESIGNRILFFLFGSCLYCLFGLHDAPVECVKLLVGNFI